MAIELVWLKKIDFFPPRPDTPDWWADQASICIATKSRNLGDALMLTTLPERLRERYPRLRIHTYPRGFNPIVFKHNPAIAGVSYLPDRVYGDDCNWGSGHLIHLKEQFFGLEPGSVPRPRIFLSDSERRRFGEFLARKTMPENEGKPLCVLHPWASTRKKVAEIDFWDRIVERWGKSFRFWQVGVEGHSAIKGCEYYLLLPRGFRHARKLFAAMDRADAFIGLDSGPMHVARAFDVRSLVLVDHVDPKQAFAARGQNPYFLQGNATASFLYEENAHLHYPSASQDEIDAEVDRYLRTTLKERGQS